MQERTKKVRRCLSTSSSSHSSLIAVFTYFGRATAKKVAGATEAISEEEGQNARNAAENLNEDSIKRLGEN